MDSTLKPALRRLPTLLVGRSVPGRLPQRVATALHAQEQESEILVCLAQLGAIVFFGAFYAISPKAFPPDAPFEPVPVTLAAYAVFTGIRLVLALRRALSDWFLAISVVMDIAVLMLTIWSFHLQYAQPPGLYLKAPTLLYVFIIIALRALRFDARWLVLAGAAAVVGWGVLVLYALGASTVTRSYVDYMTSFDVLIGAEVDKLVSLTAVTVILTLAIVRARRLLLVAATEESAAAELSRFFARDVAETIRGSDGRISPGEGMLREAAAMFVDLRGFTRLAARLSPAELVALLGEYQRCVAEVVHAHDGSITTYLGDGVMVTFGATRESVRWAADALAAASALLQKLGDWQAARAALGLPAPGFGIGICSGQVIYGAIGDERRLEYAVIGDPVNRAAKIQNHTKMAGVRALAAAELLDTAARQGVATAEFPRIRDVCVAGIEERIDLAVIG
jgi:adenylate cyclase